MSSAEAEGRLEADIESSSALEAVGAQFGDTEVYRIAYEAGNRWITLQNEQLETIRRRSLGIFGVTSASLAFLGGTIVTTAEPSELLKVSALVGTLLYCSTVVAMLLASKPVDFFHGYSPRELSTRYGDFRPDADGIVSQGGFSETRTLRVLARDQQQRIDSNRATLEHLIDVLKLQLGLTGVTFAVWIATAWLVRLGS